MTPCRVICVGVDNPDFPYGKMSPMRNDQTIRVISIINELSSHKGYTLKELAEKHSVTKRTIQRDLECIEVLGFAIQNYSDLTGDVRWKLMKETNSTFDVPFKDEDLISLLLALNSLSFFKGTELYENLVEICEKIKNRMHSPLKESMNELSDLFKNKTTVKNSNNRIMVYIHEFAESYMDRHKMKLVYFSRNHNQIRRYVIHPYRIQNYDNNFYLVAFVEEYGELRRFAIDDRIRELDRLEDSFVPVKQEVIDAYISRNFGIIDDPPLKWKIRFVGSVEKRLIRRPLHATQKIKKTRNGDVIVSFTAGGKFEILYFVMSYGTKAEVLEPAEIREELKQLYVRLVDTYSQPADTI